MRWEGGGGGGAKRHLQQLNPASGGENAKWNSLRLGCEQVQVAPENPLSHRSSSSATAPPPFPLLLSPTPRPATPPASQALCENDLKH